MSKLNEGEVLTKLTEMLNDSYMQGYQDALNTKLSEQHKLSIPKEIAEELEEVANIDWEYWEFYIYSERLSDELSDWLNSEDNDEANSKIGLAFLAGKALGVELVEIEG